MAKNPKIIDASPLGGIGLRLIGTTDLAGQGTSHEIAQVDPIVLFDFAEFKASSKSEFRPHPHVGLTAMSFLPQQGAWMAWDSLKGDTPERLHPGGLYYVHAGRPAFHHEFAAPETVEAGDVIEFIQLVWNATDETDVETVIIQPGDIPVVESESANIRVMAGEFCGVSSIQPFTHRKIIYSYVQLRPGKALELAIPESMNGIIFPIEGNLTVDNLALNERQMMILGDHKSGLSTNNSSDETVRFIVAAGEPVNRPFYKLIGLGGFIIGDSAEGLRNEMEGLEVQAEQLKEEIPHYFPEQYLV